MVPVRSLVVVLAVIALALTGCSGSSDDEATADSRPSATTDGTAGPSPTEPPDDADDPATTTTTAASAPVSTAPDPGTQATTPPTAGEAPKEGGTYRGAFGAGAFGTLDAGARLVRDEVVLVVAGDRVTALDGHQQVDGLVTETRVDGTVCRATLTVTLALAQPVPLAGGTATTSATLRTAQSTGTPSGGAPCDPELAGESTVPFDARITVDGSAAQVQLLAEGQVAVDLALWR